MSSSLLTKDQEGCGPVAFRDLPVGAKFRGAPNHPDLFTKVSATCDRQGSCLRDVEMDGAMDALVFPVLEVA